MTLGIWLILALCGEPAGNAAMESKAQAPVSVAPSPSPAAPDEESQESLAKVRRVYVDVLTGGNEALQFRDMIMSSLQQAKVFMITENPDRADAILKGAADDLIFTDHHDTSESLTAHANAMSSSGYRSRYDGSNSSQENGLQVGDSESSHIEERKHEAFAAMRLVNKDGDVIWSSTQESLGGKFSGAAVDVAGRISRQLADDTRRARAAHAGGNQSLHPAS